MCAHTLCQNSLYVSESRPGVWLEFFPIVSKKSGNELAQGLVNCSCKKPGNKYFRLCGPQTLSQRIVPLWCDSDPNWYVNKWMSQSSNNTENWISYTFHTKKIFCFLPQHFENIRIILHSCAVCSMPTWANRLLTFLLDVLCYAQGTARSGRGKGGEEHILTSAPAVPTAQLWSSQKVLPQRK